jgi:hypothetical protein
MSPSPAANIASGGFSVAPAAAPGVAKYTTKKGSGNYIIGVNSHYYESDPTTMYSPYFSDFRELLAYTKNGCN